MSHPHAGSRRAFIQRAFVRRHGLLIAAGAIVVALTALVFTRLMILAGVDEREKFGEHAQWMADRFSDELRGAEAALWGARAFVQSSEHVTRAEWREYVTTAHPHERHAGVLGLSYIAIVPSEELSEFVELARLDGAPDFTIHAHHGVNLVPLGEPHYIVFYHEPAEANRAAWGLDVTTDPINLEAYDASRFSDAVRVSRGFHLYQLPDPDARGVVMALPVRSPDREVVGWVAAPVLVNDAFTAAVGTRWRGAWVRVSDPNASGEILYQSGGAEPTGPLISLPVLVGGRVWTFESAPSGGAVLAGERAEAWIVLAAGSSLTIIIMTLVWSLTRTRDRARALATKMTASYAESEAQVRLLAEQAGAASDAKSLFLANMSHELRTPLTSVLGDAALLGDRQAALDADSQQALDAISRNGQRLLRLVDDALEVSSGRGDGAPIAPEECDITGAIEDAVHGVRARAEANGVRIETDIELDPGATLRTDPLRLHQVITNLLNNAVNFAGDGGKVQIGASGGKEHVQIRVWDSGPGVAGELRERVFEPFFQADPSHTRNHGGAGLGLAIARRLVRRMGGELTLEGQAGSVFLVELPAMPAKTHTPQPSDTSEPGEPRPVTMHGRVLVAEDGEDSRRLIAWMLRRAGLEVALCADGSTAVQFTLDAKQMGEPFDAVLMDMQMPVLDGYDATRELRARGYAGPIIALTAHAMEGDREKCLAAGCDGYQVKPIDRDTLLRAIAQSMADTTKA